jgi:CheY-like chemotaxis protein
LRADPRFDALPILAMTAHAMAGERERCLALGMQDYITKPLVPAQLFATLGRWIGRNGGEQAAADAEPRSAVAAGADGPAAAALPSAADAAPAAAAVPPVQAPLPEVTGLDTGRLLAHCDHQPALARRLLRGVGRDYADGLAGWRAWADAADWPALRHAAHTLQGLAGTLAADGLRAAAVALEQAAAVGDAAAVDRHLSETETALARLLTALDAVRTQLDDAPPAPPQAAEGMVAARPGAGRAEPDLAELSALLADSDSRAIDWWQTHELALGDRLEPVTLRALSRAIARFDFDAALALCERTRAEPAHAALTRSESTL